MFLSRWRLLSASLTTYKAGTAGLTRQQVDFRRRHELRQAQALWRRLSQTKRLRNRQLPSTASLQSTFRQWKLLGHFPLFEHLQRAINAVPILEHGFLPKMFSLHPSNVKVRFSEQRDACGVQRVVITLRRPKSTRTGGSTTSSPHGEDTSVSESAFTSSPGNPDELFEDPACRIWGFDWSRVVVSKTCGPSQPAHHDECREDEMGGERSAVGLLTVTDAVPKHDFRGWFDDVTHFRDDDGNRQWFRLVSVDRQPPSAQLLAALRQLSLDATGSCDAAGVVASPNGLGLLLSAQEVEFIAAADSEVVTNRLQEFQQRRKEQRLRMDRQKPIEVHRPLIIKLAKNHRRLKFWRAANVSDDDVRSFLHSSLESIPLEAATTSPPQLLLVAKMANWCTLGEWRGIYGDDRRPKFMKIWCVTVRQGASSPSRLWGSPSELKEAIVARLLTNNAAVAGDDKVCVTLDLRTLPKLARKRGTKRGEKHFVAE